VKRAQEVLIENEKLQREFVANVSHDLRTPVAAIKGFAETLLRGGMEDQKNRFTFVKAIERNADRLEWLIEDLLTLSLIDSGKILRKPETINLSKFVYEFVYGIMPLCKQKKIAVKTMSIDPTLEVYADKTHLAKILQN